MAATPFTFTPTDFKDGSTGGTPITAAELNKINTGISQLYESLPHYVVAASTDTPPSTPCVLIVVNAGAYGGSFYADGSTVTQIHWPSKPPVTLQKDTSMGVAFWSNGRSCVVALNYEGSGEVLGSFAKITSQYVIPAGYRPPTTLDQFIRIDQQSGSTLMLYIAVDGTISIANQSFTSVTLTSGKYVSATTSWPI